MKLSAHAWSAALNLLDAALALPASARAGWLEALAPEHAHLRVPLRELLDDRAAIETGNFLGQLPPLPAVTSPVAALAEGHRIGPYALLRELGHGGMASVWLARRADAAHGREVALKLPHLGPRAHLLAQRFVRECSILSGLTHAHIASVLDAGVDGAQPWLAMEYVDGRTLTEFAVQERLNTAARLRLFLQVLRAVQHAHAQLVIHRDIKPSNVLVDGAGHVKLLDFGVAKLLDGEGASQETELTQIGGRALTPQYASPEQVAGQPLGTASDVYSLGVLLHELLTGRPPYQLKRATVGALEEAILAAQTVRPSSAVADAATARALRGDVDTIVAKALAPTPAERYASAEAFAQDIDRHLHALPILARRASWRYRGAKLLQRHAVAFGAGAAIALALVAGTGVALWQAQVAHRESQRAQAVQRFLSDALSLNDPEQALGRELSARELLDLSAQRIDSQFAGDTATRAQLHHTVGRIYLARGAAEQARPHLDAAADLYEASGQRGTQRHIEALFSRGEVFSELADFDAARQAGERTRHEAQRAFGPQHRWSARLLANEAWYDLHQGRPATARERGEQALALQRTLTGETSFDYVAIAVELAHVELDAGNFARARALFEQLQRIGDVLPDYPQGDRLMDRYNLARVRFVTGDFVGLEAELRDLVPKMESHFGPPHDRTIVGRSLLAQTLAHSGQFDAAIELQRANLARTAARGIDGDEAVAQQTLVLALVLNLAARYDEALAPARSGLAYYDAKYPQPTTYRERGRWILGETLLGLGDATQGTALLRLVLANVNAMQQQGQPLAKGPATLSLAVAVRQGEGVAAACAAYERSTGAASWPSLRCRAIESWIAAAAAHADQRAGPLAQFRAVRERLFAVLPATHGLRSELIAAEAELLAPDEARALRAQANAVYTSTFGRGMPTRLLVVH